MPTELTVSIQSRPSPAIEAICYFCAAELLSNVAQHAQASRTSLTCAQHGPWLRIVVRDNGARWCHDEPGRLVLRAAWPGSPINVAAVDGHLSIASSLRGDADRRHGRPALSLLSMADAGVVRVVIAEDSAILRDGLVQLLTDRGFAVTRAVSDAAGLEQAVAADPPDVAVVDVRMPPTFTDEGLRAALVLRRSHPTVGILVSSRSTSRPVTPPNCSRAARPGSATYSRTGSPTSQTSWKP